MGDLPSRLPSFGLPNVPFNFATLEIILPVALTLSAVGLLESFLMASVLDDMTDTNSDKNQEARGQGMANLITDWRASETVYAVCRDFPTGLFFAVSRWG